MKTFLIKHSEFADEMFWLFAVSRLTRELVPSGGDARAIRPTGDCEVHQDPTALVQVADEAFHRETGDPTGRVSRLECSLAQVSEPEGGNTRVERGGSGDDLCKREIA